MMKHVIKVYGICKTRIELQLTGDEYTFGIDDQFSCYSQDQRMVGLASLFINSSLRIPLNLVGLLSHLKSITFTTLNR